MAVAEVVETTSVLDIISVVLVVLGLVVLEALEPDGVGGGSVLNLTNGSTVQSTKQSNMQDSPNITSVAGARTLKSECVGPNDANQERDRTGTPRKDRRAQG